MPSSFWHTPTFRGEHVLFICRRDLMLTLAHRVGAIMYTLVHPYLNLIEAQPSYIKPEKTAYKIHDVRRTIYSERLLNCIE